MSTTTKGFTLVELLIALAVSGIIMTGVYSAFKTQQDSYLAQEQVAEMQQNIRAGLYLMARELRMAGYKGDGSSSASIVAAQNDAIAFSVDFNGDGDVDDAGENIGYDLYDSSAAGSVVLGRAVAGSTLSLSETPAGSGHYEVSSHQPLAENIEQLEFLYSLDDGTQTLTPTAAQLPLIRSVQISMLAITSHPDRNYTNNQSYAPASASEISSGVDWTPTPDNLRRRFQTMTVKCRNIGL